MTDEEAVVVDRDNFADLAVRGTVMDMDAIDEETRALLLSDDFFEDWMESALEYGFVGVVWLF